MISNPDMAMFLFLALISSAGAYFVGFAMNGVLEEDGFGVFLNTLILIAGGFLGFHATRYVHLPIPTTSMQAMLVVSGAFLSLALLAIMKNVARRTGF